jgi:hypothetical protein
VRPHNPYEENLRDEYLRKAAEAEREENLATDRQAKEAWERIVVSYLELAALIAARRGGTSF